MKPRQETHSRNKIKWTIYINFKNEELLFYEANVLQTDTGKLKVFPCKELGDNMCKAKRRTSDIIYRLMKKSLSQEHQIHPEISFFAHNKFLIL